MKRNKGNVKEQRKRYRAKHKEELKIARKKYYEANKERVLFYNKKRLKIFQKKYREHVLSYKKDKCCERCGYNEHTEILQFHHLRDKEFTISENDCIKKFDEEIKKCILLCPNCHSLHHLNERNKNAPRTD